MKVKQKTVEEKVLQLIKEHPEGIKFSELLELIIPKPPFTEMQIKDAVAELLDLEHPRVRVSTDRKIFLINPQV